MAKLRSEAMDELNLLPGGQCMQGKRDVRLKYRGWQIVGKATCAAEQLDMGLQAGLRGYASAAGDIPVLPAETLLCKDPEKAVKGKICESFLREAVSARKFALSMVEADGCINGEALKDSRSIILVFSRANLAHFKA